MKKLLILTASTLLLGLAPLGTVEAVGETKESTVSVSFEKDPAPLKIIAADVFEFSAPHSILESNVKASEDVTVSIMDNNGAGDIGWTLQARIDAFTQDDKVSLKGAVITLPIAKASHTESTKFAPPTLSGITLSGENGIVADAKRTADSTVGYGPWTFTWTGSEINLNIPEGISTPGAHATTVTWTMLATPS